MASAYSAVSLLAIGATPAAASSAATLTPINGTPSSGPIRVVSYHYELSYTCSQPYGCAIPSGSYTLDLFFTGYTKIGEAAATVDLEPPPPGSQWSTEHGYGEISGTIPDWPRSQPTTYTLTAELIDANHRP